MPGTQGAGCDGSALRSGEETGQVLAMRRGKPLCWEHGGVQQCTGGFSNACDSRTHGTNTQHSPRATQKARKTHRGHPVLAAGMGQERAPGKGHIQRGARSWSRLKPCLGTVTLPYHAAEKHPAENTNGLKINTSCPGQESGNLRDVGGHGEHRREWK